MVLRQDPKRSGSDRLRNKNKIIPVVKTYPLALTNKSNKQKNLPGVYGQALRRAYENCHFIYLIFFLFINGIRNSSRI